MYKTDWFNIVNLEHTSSRNSTGGNKLRTYKLFKKFKILYSDFTT